MCEWGEDEVIRNDNEVEKAEQGQYQRYPSKSSPTLILLTDDHEASSICNMQRVEYLTFSLLIN
jgi:hypothetical protein